MSVNIDLQTVIYTLLDSLSIPSVKSIIDHPITSPPDDVYPFIELADSQVIPNDASNGSVSDTGVDEFIDIHVWSRYRGQKEVKEIMSAIYDALHHNSLSIPGRSSAFCWFDNSRIRTDPDGLTRHGIQTFKITHRS